jgi:hypothetical protein
MHQMSAIRGSGPGNGLLSPFETVVNQAIGVLTVRDRASVAEASASLDEMARASGRDVGDVAADVVCSTVKDVGEVRRPPLVIAEREVDVEVLVDDVWWPGYLYGRDWQETAQRRWVCFVRFNTWGSPNGRIENLARHFDEDHIRPAKVPAQRGRPA